MKNFSQKLLGTSTIALLALVATGCGNGDNGGSDDNGENGGSTENGTEENGAPDQISGQFLTGASGGVWDILGGGIAQVINDNIDYIRLNPSNPPGIGHIPNQLAGGEAVMGFLQVDQISRALAGEGEFEEAMDGLTNLVPLYANVMVQFAHDGSQYENISDVEGATVAAASDAQQTMLTNMYEIAGVDTDTIDWILMPYGEIASAFHDGDIDVATFTGYPHNGSLEEVVITSDVQWLEIDEDVLEEFNDQNPLNQTTIIPAGTYPDQDHDVPFYAVYAALAAHESLDDQAAYDIAEVLMTNPDRLAQVHPAGEEINQETVEWFFEVGLVSRDEIHPGSLQYFEDEGFELD